MNYLKEKLKEKGIMQKELAMRTGITESAISRYCNGQRRVALENVIVIAKVLDVPLEELIENIIKEK